ncbi:MAG: zinc ribbon domain-containing protein, partial [Bacteroidaceae bacterium]|nr:zinc ribbon domain-containing protein [Bacteroidaceae bacterium]
MAYCGKCGNQIDEGVKFCPFCGAALQVAQPETVQPEPQQPVQPEPTAEEKLQQATQTIDSVAQKLGNTADHSAEYDKTDAEANKVMALLSYFGILVLVPIFAAKHSPFVRYHANQGVVL